jgi:WD40 repeat protein
VLRRSTLERLGGAERIVRSHLDEVMAGLSNRQNQVAAAVFHHLVTSSGTKIALTAEDLADWSDLDVDDVRDLLESLSSGQQRILRPVPPPAGSTGPPHYEIYHDVMGAAVLDWRRRYVAHRDHERASRRLVAEREHAQAEAATARRRLRRVRLVAVAMALALVAVSLLGYVAIQRDRTARREGRQAREHEQLSVAAGALDTDPAASLRAAVAAEHIHDDTDSREAILLAAGAPRSEIISGPDPLAADMAVTGDGEHVVVFDRAGGVHEFGATGPETATARVPVSGAVVRGVVAEDGHTAAIVTDRGQVALVDLATGKSTVLRATGSAETRIALVPAQSKLVAVLYGDGTPTEVYDAATGYLAARLDAGAWAVTGSPDRNNLVTSDGDGHIRVRDLSTGATRASSTQLSDAPQFLQWYKNEIVGVTAGEEVKHLVVWDWTAGPAPKTAKIDWAREVQQARVDPASGTIVIAYDKTAWTYDLETGKPQRVLPSHSDWVYDGEPSKQGRWIVTAGGDGRVLVWTSEFATFQTARPTYELLGHRGAVLQAAYLGDGATIVSIGLDGTVRRWHLPTVERSDEQTDWVLDVQSSADGQWFASASQDGTVRVFRAGDLRTAATIATDSPIEVRFDPNDAHTVYTLGLYDRTLQEWQWTDDGDVGLVRRFEEIPAGAAALWRFDISRDGRTVAGGDTSGHVHLWDTATGRRRDAPIAFDEPGTGITDVAFDPTVPDGDRLAVATDRDVTVWSRTAPGSPLVLDDRNVANVVFDEHGSHIAVSEEGGTVKMWSSDGHLLHAMAVHGGRAGRPTFNAAGTLLAVGTAEGLIEVRDVASGSTVMLSRVHGDSVNDVAFMPGDDGRIVSVSDDTTVARSSCAACTNPDAVIDDARQWVDANP